MEQEFARTIRPKLDVIDKVRPYLAEQDIDLPAIVVIGDQSSGKSSLLESISGVALPRGGEIVTRCPLQLALRPGPEEAKIEYKNPNGKKVVARLRLEDVAKAVSEATDCLSGVGQGISHELIFLQVTRPDAPILTVVDLPGITRMAVGDQPLDIEAQVKNLINKYVEGKAKIILCVLPATQDFATQEALTMAKEHDPDGTRTIGVVTKIDQCQKDGMRRNLEATAPGCVKLRLGFVAVRSRTPKELEHRISAAEMLQKEEKFFHNHHELRDLAPEMKGLPALIQKLIRLQDQRLQEFLPDLKKQVREQLQSMQKRIMEAGNIATTDSEAEVIMITCTNQLQQRFDRLTKAIYEGEDRGDAKSHLHLAPRLNELAKEYINKAWESFGGQAWAHSKDCRDILQGIIRESTGVALPDDGNSTAVYDTFRANVAACLLDPSLSYLEDAHELILAAVQELAKDAFSEFPNLCIVVQDQLAELLLKAQDAAKWSIQDILDRQDDPYTQDGYYMYMYNAYRAAAERYRSSTQDPPKDQQHYAWQEEQELDGAKAQLRAERTQDEKALREQQFRLAAFTTVVLRLLSDEVGKKMFETVLAGVRQMETSMLALMQDPVRVRQYEADKDTLHKLEKAFAELKKV